MHWNFTQLEQAIAPETPDDVAFVADLLDALEAELCIDPTRVFSTGISNGAMMSVRLGCDLSDRIAAIAPIAGLYYPPWSPDLEAEPPCAATRPIPVIAFHGTGDSVVPYEGGPLGIEFPFSVRNIETEVLPAWAAHNGCASTPTTAPVTDNVDVLRYDGCAEGATVELYRVEGGEHIWPGVPDDVKPPDPADEISANELLWQFFETHPSASGGQAAPTPSATPQATTVAPTPTAQPISLPSSGGGASGGTKGIASLAALLAGAGALSAAAWFVRTRTRP